MADASDIDRFMSLFTRHEPRVHAYILSLLADPVAAEDVLQETNAILWKKFGQYDPGSNFFAWACQIARFEVSRHRRKQSRDRLRFSDAFVEAVAEETASMAEELESRRRLLHRCVRKLRPVDQDLIYLRYGEGHLAKDVAAQVGRSADAIYKALDRIRKTLMQCVAEGAEA